VSVNRRNLLLLFGLALVVNTLVAVLIKTPGASLDAYYYFNGGVLIAEHGLTLQEPYFWNWVSAPDVLPAPAFNYWQPMPSFLAALGISIFRTPLFGAAQVPFVLLASLLPPMTYIIAEQLDERQDSYKRSLIAGFVMLFPGFYLVNWVVPETFTPYAVFGAACLMFLSQGLASEEKWWSFGLAGVSAALAHLTRGDGVLLLLVVVGIIIGIKFLPPTLPTDTLKGGGESAYKPNGKQRSAANVIVAIGGYLVIMLPWFVRNLNVFGSVLPPGGFNTIWMVQYNDLFLYDIALTPKRFLTQGIGPILKTRLDVLWTNVQSVIAVNNLIFFTPLTVVGVWKRWRHPWVLPALVYGMGLFGAMTVVFALPGQRGGWFHSSAALMPFIVPIAVLGLEDTLRWVSARRRGWRFVQAWKVFSVALVVLAAGLSVLLMVRAVPGWDAEYEFHETLADVFEAEGVPADAIVMSNNTPAVHFYTGRGGVPLVDGDENTLLHIADKYGVQYLLLPDVPVGLEEMYRDGPQSERFELIGQVGDTKIYRIDG